MPSYKSIILLIILAFALSSIVSADRLPNATNASNRQYPTSTYIEVIGMMDSHTQYQVESSSHGAHEGGFLYSGETVSSVVYKNDMSTNGGYLSQNKGVKLDEGPQQKSGFNVDSQIVTTYLTDPEKGSKMTNAESVEMYTSGNWTPAKDVVRNPLVADIIGEYVGGFNGHYKAAAETQMTTGQIGQMAKARSVGTDDSVPAEVRYTLGVHPDMSTGLPYADGLVKTEFLIENEEGSSNTYNLSQVFKAEDSTTVNGMIFNFGKGFTAVSGLQPT